MAKRPSEGAEADRTSFFAFDGYTGTSSEPSGDFDPIPPEKRYKSHSSVRQRQRDGGPVDVKEDKSYSAEEVKEFIKAAVDAALAEKEPDLEIRGK
jgi:hypothetical protein